MINFIKSITAGICLLALAACNYGGPAETLATVDSLPTVCCKGNCDTPEGTCCSDGTCNGNHIELPLAKKE
ncbi:MAG: hypothetical protein QGF46_02620 [Planctomycetota bacterium]|jgi:hypothetical protein|nr:hypothetical protein [Planctomycetota bacterium]